jgi:excisionase family DNA binding protein
MDRLYTTQEAAEFLRISCSSLNHWRLEGRGPAFTRFGRQVRYRRADLESWLAEMNEGATGR